MNQLDLISMEKAAEHVGVSYWTIRRRILDGDLVAFRDERDRRKKLVLISDLEELFAPSLLEGISTKGGDAQ